MAISIGKGQDRAPHYGWIRVWISEYKLFSEGLLLILLCNISIISSIEATIETDKYNIIIRLLSECNYQKADNFYQMNSF